MNKVIKNYFYNVSYQLLIILIPLITTPYVSRVLGAEGVGTFSYSNSIVQYFILLGTIGLNLYGQREIAYYQNDKENRDKTFWELVLLRSITIGISLSLFLIMLVFKKNSYSIFFLIMTLDLIASAIDISWFFQGIEDFKKIVVRNFFVKIIGVVLIFLFVKKSDDLILYVFCHSITMFLGNLSMWMYIPKLVGKIKLKNLKIFVHLRPTIRIFVPQIAVSLYTIFDKTMIGLLTGSTAEVAYYEQGQKIIKIVLTVVTSMGTVMMPRIAHLYQQENLDKIKKYLLLSIKYIFILSFPMTFGIIGISGNLVPWFFGAGYDKVVPNMMIISPIIVCIAFSGLFGTQYLLAVGREKEYSRSVITGTVVNVMLNLLLIPRLLSIGAAIATVIAESAVIVVQLKCLKKEFSIKEIVSGNWKYVISSVIMGVVVFRMSRVLESTIINTIIIVFVGIIIYLAQLLLIYRDKTLLDFIKKMLEK